MDIGFVFSIKKMLLLAWLAILEEAMTFGLGNWPCDKQIITEVALRK